MTEEADRPTPRLSPDGRFYFDGTAWHPFITSLDPPAGAAGPGPASGPASGPAHESARPADHVIRATSGPAVTPTGVAVQVLVGIPILVIMVPVIVWLLLSPGTRLTGCLLMIGPAVIAWRIWPIIQESRQP